VATILGPLGGELVTAVVICPTPASGPPKSPHVKGPGIGAWRHRVHMEHIGIEPLAWISSDNRVGIVRNEVHGGKSSAAFSIRQCRDPLSPLVISQHNWVACLVVGRQCERKSRASRRIVSSPQAAAMRLDDGAAD